MLQKVFKNVMFKRRFQLRVDLDNCISYSSYLISLFMNFQIFVKIPMYCGESKWGEKRRNIDMAIFCGII